MMTSKTKYLAFAALAAMLAGCSNEDDFAPQESLKDTPITVNVGVAELSTRAGYEGTTPLPETFYLSIDQEGEKYDYTNVLVTKGNKNTYTTESQLLWAGNSDVSVTAATFSLDGAQTLGVKNDQSSENNVKLSDLLFYSNSAVTPSSSGISVNFSHIMSKVILTITLGDEFDFEKNPISEITFKGTVASRSYTAGSGWADIASGAATTDITPQELTYTEIGGEVKNATAKYEVILVPQEVAANCFTVSFNVGDRVFEWKSDKEISLSSGIQYTLDLTAGKDKVSSASFSVSNWGTGNDNGKLETE